jgi:hypothetical protein
MPPPLDAVPLDAEAALLMLRSYDESLWHRLVFVHDLDRAAVIARAVYERRYGRQAAVAMAIAVSQEEEEPPAPAVPRQTSKRKSNERS